MSNRTDTPRLERDPTSAPARPRGLGVLAAVVTGCLVAAVTFGVWAFRVAGGEDDAAGSDAMDHTDHGADGATGSDAGGTGHDGHLDGEVLAGCDADSYHASMMMFDPFVADGLVDSGCTWPYSADIEVAGGAEDPSIDAPFEPRRYAEVYDLLTAERLGMCAVARMPDDTVDGFVFGFATQLHPGGCADGVATVSLSMREYATRAWRDTAAAAARDTLATSGDAAVVVLGRWVITVGGDDADAAEVLAESIAALDGAATISA